mmetsp:Transcript_596/g.992  ORF Transcript_596/g.992 Transcript_596/m.992 type:complete len:110 (-) Transcript_596:1674-2003(-)
MTLAKLYKSRTDRICNYISSVAMLCFMISLLLKEAGVLHGMDSFLEYSFYANASAHLGTFTIASLCKVYKKLRVSISSGTMTHPHVLTNATLSDEVVPPEKAKVLSVIL